MVEILVALCIVTLPLLAVLVMLSEVGEMARVRGCAPWLWWALSIGLTPFGSMFVLWAFFDLKAAG